MSRFKVCIPEKVLLLMFFVLFISGRDASAEWTTETAATNAFFYSAYSFSNAIAVDSKNNTHMLFTGPSGTLKYTTNSSGSWETTSRDIYLPPDKHQYLSIVIDSKDNVHYIFYDGAGGSLRYTSNASGDWLTSTVPTGSGSLLYASLAIDSKDMLHITYTVQTDIYSGYSELAYATNESGTWSREVVDSPLFGVSFPSIAIDSEDKVHISYYAKGPSELRYTTNRNVINPGDSWHRETIVNNVKSHSIWNTSIAVDSADNIHMGYSQNNPAKGTWWQDLKYVTNASGSWALEIVDNTSNALGPLSIAIDSQDKVHFAYTAGPPENFTGDFSAAYALRLNYATNASGSWAIDILDDTSDHLNTAIAIDSLGKVHVSCFDVWVGHLKYVSNVLSNVPVADIKINNTDDQIILPMNSHIRAEISLDPKGYAGQQADWWVWAKGKEGLFWFKPGSGWLRSSPRVSYQGSLSALTSYHLFDITFLPVGDYIVNFAVDINSDGVLDASWKDSVRIKIKY